MSKVHINDEITAQKKRGVLLVLTGPTGAGKDTVFEKLLAENKNLIKITTTTSRSMRAAESQGNPYFFKSRQDFEKMIARGEFFEWVEFRGELYGTQQKTIEDAIDSGHDVIWHIDAKGIKNIKQKVKEMVNRCVFVFLTAPNIQVLQERVKADEGKQVVHRWNEALVVWEMEQFDDCDYLVVNEDDKLPKAVSQVEAIIEAKRQEIL